MKNIHFTEVKFLSEIEIHNCALMMSDSEPWITLKRNYDAVVLMLNNDKNTIYLAKCEEDIIGFAIIVNNGAFVGFIQSIVIKENFRGIGIGSKFLKFIEDNIFSVFPNVFICVSSFNPNAKRLYERSGYTEIGELKDYIVSGHSEILLRKTISPISEY